MTPPTLFGAALLLGAAICHADRPSRCLNKPAQILQHSGGSGDSFHVGIVQWNVKDSGVTDSGNSAILTASLAKALSDDPELFAFTYQENLYPDKTEAWLKNNGLPTEYTKLGHHWRHAGMGNMKKFHGSSGVMVFHKPKGHEVQAGTAYQSEWHSMMTGNNDEKGLSALPVTIGGKKVCFGSAHVDVGKWGTSENVRLSAFKEYTTVLRDAGCSSKDLMCEICDVAWFGGDFNWRNGGWKKDTDQGIAKEKGKGVHSHFTADGVQEYFAALDLSSNTFYQAKPSGTADLPAVLVANDERKQREGGWLEGPSDTADVSLNYPPTFQPSKCPQGGVDGSLAGEKTTAEDGDKDPVCLKTKSGGNCDNAICMSAQRPLAFTDAIYHRSISNVMISSILYGPVIMPMASDHFPMVGSWSAAF